MIFLIADEEEAKWRRLLLFVILLHTWLQLTGMLLADSSANTAEIVSFWSSVNGTLAGGGTITGISADAGRGRLPDGDGERASDVDGWGLARLVTLAGKSGWRSGHQSRPPPLLQCCMWIEFQSIST